MQPLSDARHTAVGLVLALAAAVLLSAPANAADQRRVEISNLKTKLRIDVMWASQKPFQGVFLWPNNSSRSQEFDLLDSGGVYFRIRARHSGQCLTIDRRSGSSGNGTAVVQSRNCDPGHKPAEWRRGWVGYAPECDGKVCSTRSVEYPILINRFSGRCLDARNPSSRPPRAQMVLQQWRCITTADAWNAANQLWRFGNETYW